VSGRGPAHPGSAGGGQWGASQSRPRVPMPAAAIVSQQMAGTLHAGLEMGARMAETELRPTAERDATLDRLVAEVAAGDRVAFETLYRATSARLYGICLRVLADRSEAEDVLQDAFVTIWHRSGQFDSSRAGALAWLSTIARNRAIDRLRARPPMSRAPLAALEEVADPGTTPDRDAETSTDRGRLERCLEQLDERRRGLIRTAFFDGATYDELAAQIGAPLGSVKSWIRRGLMQLKACLET
jgi:RNA polymerase sigma-70 factor (ECF subfamily)